MNESNIIQPTTFQLNREIFRNVIIVRESLRDQIRATVENSITPPLKSKK